MSTAQNNRLSKRGLFWALLPVGMLVSTAVGVLLVVSIAVGDPGFSVEKDYYRRALNYDAEIEQQKRNVHLGWQVNVRIEERISSRRIVAELSDRSSKPVVGASVTGEAFALARGQAREILSFIESSPGLYTANLTSRRTGIWELRLVAQLGNDRFTKSVRQDVVPLAQN